MSDTKLPDLNWLQAKVKRVALKLASQGNMVAANSLRRSVADLTLYYGNNVLALIREAEGDDK